MSEYPKWVQRAPHIGPVLCSNAKEEEKLLEDWAEEQLEAAQEAAAQAKAFAQAAKEVTQVQLKPAGKGR